MADQAFDAVHRPQHYNSHPSGVQTIEVTEQMSFCLGNAVKYVWRAGLKGAPVEDLRKALWYVVRASESPAPRPTQPRRVLPVVRFLEHEPSEFVRGVVESLWYADAGSNRGANLTRATTLLRAEIARRAGEGAGHG